MGPPMVSSTFHTEDAILILRVVPRHTAVSVAVRLELVPDKRLIHMA